MAKKLHDLDVDDYLAECVAIEPTALEEEFVRLPADLAYWNERYSVAYKAQLRAELDRKRVEARLYLECRETLMQAAAREAEPESGDTAGTKAVKRSVKAPTTDQIAAAVQRHPEMIAAQDRELDAEADSHHLRGVLDAVRSKKDALVSIGAQLRAEMQGDPVIRDQVRGTRLSRDGF